MTTTLLIALLAAATLCIGWCLFGWFLYVRLKGRGAEDTLPPEPERWPSVTIVVPMRNEMAQLPAKLANTRAQMGDYPGAADLIFCEGSSDDGSRQWLDAHLEEGRRERVLTGTKCSKGPAVNQGLRHAGGEIVVFTDADAQLAPGALRAMVRELRDPEVEIVGAWTEPADATWIVDRYYWQTQNAARLLEQRAKSASIVVGPAYAARRSEFQPLPEDTLADDVHISYRAHVAGRRVVYSRHARALELRNPANGKQFWRHKLRKSHGVLREGLRFARTTWRARGFARLMLLTRLMQQLALPWAGMLWLVCAVLLLGLGSAGVTAVAISSGLLLGLFATTSVMFRSVEAPAHGDAFSIWTGVRCWILTVSILFVTGLAYPFMRRSDTFVPVDAEAKRTG